MVTITFHVPKNSGFDPNAPWVELRNEKTAKRCKIIKVMENNETDEYLVTVEAPEDLFKPAPSASISLEVE